jgi:pimeloyl-ACP methyl ester carboxylesterase
MMPALVLVHGGGLAADSWELTVDEINRIAPELAVLAVDLPGRRGKPGDLRTVTIADFVDSVVADIADAGLGDVVIVGHSMAGLTVPGVVAKLGPSRVRELVLAAAHVPAEGTTMASTLPWPGGPTARRRAKAGEPSETPAWMQRFVLLNGVSRARRRLMASRVYPESSRVFAEQVSRRDMPADVPRTWILTRRDRALSVKTQLSGIEAIGGVQRLLAIDTCHCLMVSEPERLAEILVECCRRYASPTEGTA